MEWVMGSGRSFGWMIWAVTLAVGLGGAWAQAQEAVRAGDAPRPATEPAITIESGAKGGESSRPGLGVDFPARTRLVMPMNVGTVIGLWERGDGRVVTLDVKSGRQVAITPGSVGRIKSPVISSDGKWLGAPDYWGKEGVHVWNLIKNTSVKLPVTQDKIWVADFHKEDWLLLALCSNQGTWSLETWNHRTAERGALFRPQEKKSITAVAVDPLGRRVFVGVDAEKADGAAMLMLDSDQLMPTQWNPKPKKAQGTQRKGYQNVGVSSGANHWRNYLGRPGAARFSPDGKLLAVAFVQGNSRMSNWITGLVVFDSETGAQVWSIDPDLLPGVSVDNDLIESRDTLQWTKDGKRLLVGEEHFCDLSLRVPLHSIPRVEGQDSDGLPRVLIGNEYVTRTAQVSRANSSETLVKIDAVRLPMDRIARAQKAIEAGGEALDGMLPAMVTPDFSGAPMARLDRVPAGAVQADPAPDIELTPSPRFAVEMRENKGKTVGTEKQVRRNGGLMPEEVVGAFSKNVAVDPVVAMLFPDGPATAALMVGEHKQTADGDWFQGITIMDLKKGRPQALLVNSVGGHPIALSGDGSRYAMRDYRSMGDRIDVYEAVPGSPAPRHVVGAMFKSGAGSRGIMFLDNDHLLINTSAELACWKLPEMKAVYRLPAAEMVKLSAGGRVLYFLSEGRVYCADPKTGRVLSDVTMALFGAKGASGERWIAFSPDGKEACVLQSSRHMAVKLRVVRFAQEGANAEHQVREWDFYDPTFSAYSGASGLDGAIDYMAPGYLLLPGGLLVRTSDGAPVVYYRMGKGVWKVVKGRFWAVKWDDDIKKNEMTWTPVPSSEVMGVSRKVTREDCLIYETPLRAKIDLNVPPEAKDNEVARNVRKRLEEIGIVDDPSNEKYRLRVWAQLETNPNLVYRSVGGDSGKTYEAKLMVGRCEVVRDGQRAWVGEAKSEGPDMFWAKPGEDVSARIAEETWKKYGQVIMSTTNSFPSLLMDYSKVPTVSLGVDSKVEATAQSRAGLQAELDGLRRYQPVVQQWITDAQSLADGVMTGKLDLRKYRAGAEALQGSVRKLGAVPEGLSDRSKQIAANIKESAGKAAKLFLDAHVANAVQNSRRVAEGPEALVNKARQLVDTDVKKGADLIAGQIKALEEQIKAIPADSPEP